MYILVVEGISNFYFVRNFIFSATLSQMKYNLTDMSVIFAFGDVLLLYTSTA